MFERMSTCGYSFLRVDRHWATSGSPRTTMQLRPDVCMRLCLIACMCGFMRVHYACVHMCTHVYSLYISYVYLAYKCVYVCVYIFTKMLHTTHTTASKFWRDMWQNLHTLACVHIWMIAILSHYNKEDHFVKPVNNKAVSFLCFITCHKFYALIHEDRYAHIVAYMTQDFQNTCSQQKCTWTGQKVWD